MNKVFVVTVFYSGDFKTSPWAVFANIKDAGAYKSELEKEYNQEEDYLIVEITEHEVE